MGLSLHFARDNNFSWSSTNICGIEWAQNWYCIHFLSIIILGCVDNEANFANSSFELIANLFLMRSFSFDYWFWAICNCINAICCNGCRVTVKKVWLAFSIYKFFYVIGILLLQLLFLLLFRDLSYSYKYRLQYNHKEKFFVNWYRAIKETLSSEMRPLLFVYVFLLSLKLLLIIFLRKASVVTEMSNAQRKFDRLYSCRLHCLRR